MSLDQAHFCWRLGLMTDSEYECRYRWAVAELTRLFDASIIAAIAEIAA